MIYLDNKNNDYNRISLYPTMSGVREEKTLNLRLFFVSYKHPKIKFVT